MKIQDLGFIIVLLILIGLRKPRLAAAAGLGCLILAMPLFHFWIFFTAQRLTMYAAAFFLVSIIYQFLDILKQR